MDKETYIKEQLAELDRQYQKARQPFFEALVKIESMKLPKPILIDISKMNSEDIDRIWDGFRDGDG